MVLSHTESIKMACSHKEWHKDHESGNSGSFRCKGAINYISIPKCQKCHLKVICMIKKSNMRFRHLR